MPDCLCSETGATYSGDKGKGDGFSISCTNKRVLAEKTGLGYDKLEKLFTGNREIVVVLSTYKPFEPRTLDAVDFAYKRVQQLRIISKIIPHNRIIVATAPTL